jgi:hypothetical protein
MRAELEKLNPNTKAVEKYVLTPRAIREKS